MLAALVVLFQIALGLPLSWKKVRLSASPQWIGLVFDFNSGYIVIPGDKLIRMLDFLQAILTGPRRAERRSTERGTGLLLWISEVHRALRPWISEFYTTLNATTVTLVSLTAQQYSDILQHTVGQSCTTKGVFPSWRLLEVAGSPVVTFDEAKQIKPSLRANFGVSSTTLEAAWSKFKITL